MIPYTTTAGTVNLNNCIIYNSSNSSVEYKLSNWSVKQIPSMVTNAITYPAITTGGVITKQYMRCLVQTLENGICREWEEMGGYYGDTTSTSGCQYWSDGPIYRRVETTQADGSVLTTDWVPWVGNGWAPDPRTVGEKMRDIIQSRQAPMLILSSRKPVHTVAQEREIRARETLRRILGEDKFRRFLRNGFVTVNGKSGKTYQIYPGHGMTVVWDKGQPVEKLCVVLLGDFTPTDSLITRYIMILHDEQRFRGHANIHSAPTKSVRAAAVDKPQKSLSEILQTMKAAA